MAAGWFPRELLCDRYSSKPLSVLDLALYNPVVADDVLHDVGGVNGAVLADLSLAGCEHVSLRAVAGLVAPGNKLARLNVSSSRNNWDRYGWRRPAHWIERGPHAAGCAYRLFASRGVALHKLKRLTMRSCHHVTEASIDSVAHKAPRLQIVDVSGCPLITDLRRATALKSLHVSSCCCCSCCTEVRNVTHAEPHAQTLLARECRGLSTFGLHGVAKRCLALHSLDLGGIGLTDGQAELCWGLPRTAYQPSRLRRLDLSENPRLTRSTLVPILDLCPDLRALRLNGCEDGADDQVLAVAAQRCTLLQELRLARCPAVSDEGLTSIGRGCPYLTILDVSHNLAITDAGMSAVGMGCRRLTTVRIAGW